jgi:hypothetical protein
VRIVPLQEQFELPLPLPVNIISGKEKPDIEREGEEAMRIAALLIQDDLAIMVEGSNGGYYFQAGAICVAGVYYSYLLLVDRLRSSPCISRFLADER